MKKTLIIIILLLPLITHNVCISAPTERVIICSESRNASLKDELDDNIQQDFLNEMLTKIKAGTVWFRGYCEMHDGTTWISIGEWYETYGAYGTIETVFHVDEKFNLITRYKIDKDTRCYPQFIAHEYMYIECGDGDEGAVWASQMLIDLKSGKQTELGYHSDYFDPREEGSFDKYDPEDFELGPAENYAEGIAYLLSKGIVEGYSDNTFKPYNPINRAEFTKIVVGAVVDEEEIIGSDCFPDVKDEWFAKYVCTAHERGLIDGYPDGTFQPAGTINFVEAAKIIAGAFELEVEEAEESPWYQKYVEALADVNAIPVSIESFDQEISRGEMAEMIFRLHSQKQDLPSRAYNDLM